jgi:hypothetical protein
MSHEAVMTLSRYDQNIFNAVKFIYLAALCLSLFSCNKSVEDVSKREIMNAESADGDAKDAKDTTDSIDVTDIQKEEEDEAVMPIHQCDPPSCESVLL